MKLDKRKLKSAQFMFLSVSDIKTEQDFKKALFDTITKIEYGQLCTGERNINEKWGLQDLQTLIDCIVFEEK